MSEEKKKEVLDQEKNLDESEMEEVSGGKGACFMVNEGVGGSLCICPAGGVGKSKCFCVIGGGGSGD